MNFGEGQKSVFDDGRVGAPLDSGRNVASCNGDRIGSLLDGRTGASLDGDRTVAQIYGSRIGSVLDVGRTVDVIYII